MLLPSYFKWNRILTLVSDLMGVLYSVIHKTRKGKQSAGGQRSDYMDWIVERRTSPQCSAKIYWVSLEELFMYNVCPESHSSPEILFLLSCLDWANTTSLVYPKNFISCYFVVIKNFLSGPPTYIFMVNWSGSA